VANYRQITVLSKKYWHDCCSLFSNELADVPYQLQKANRIDGCFIDVNNHFDKQPREFPQLNTKFSLDYKTYRFLVGQSCNIEI
jgi:hypothetical protein